MVERPIEADDEREMQDKSSDDPKKRWIAKMIKSAKRYHRLCPYYDKKTSMCLIMVTIEGSPGRCDRDGKYDGCPVFTKFLEKVYDNYKARKKILPNDFQDVVNQAYLI